MEQQQGVIPAGQILPGRNPRTYFDDVEMTELESSVRVKGILQPVLLRILPEGLAQVAGGRRITVAKRIGDDFPVPYIAREMTDQEADEAALSENTERSDMSPTEEAASAARCLAHCGGDHAEAARRLGWSPATLTKRLALMNCSEAVQKALNERKIQLGHAELLAGVSRDKQDKALANILTHSLKVEAVKGMLAQLAKSMDAAIFDKSDCAACQFNSDNQAALFSESVGTGHCTNGSCYDEKTEKELAVRRDALLESYPRVEIVRPGDNFKVIKLVAEGPKGVGEEQAQACRGCANFGAAISAVPDKLGKSYPDQCFDIECNNKKVAARIQAEQAVQKAASSGNSSKGKAASSSGKKPDANKKAAPTVEDTTRVKEYRVKVWRTITKKELMSKPDMNLAVLIALGMEGQLRNVSDSKLVQGFNQLTGQKASFTADLPAALEGAASLEEGMRKTMIMGIATSAMDTIEERLLVQIMTFLKVDLGAHWKLNEEFMKLLTKSEMESLSDELGLKSALGDKFAKTMKGKNDEIIKALLAVDGFEYVGRVPRSMQYVKS